MTMASKGGMRGKLKWIVITAGSNEIAIPEWVDRQEHPRLSRVRDLSITERESFHAYLHRVGTAAMAADAWLDGILKSRVTK
jgi:hypothetical protein